MRIEKITLGENASYAVIGEEKTALIDVPLGNPEGLISELEKVTKRIDYLVINHVNPAAGKCFAALLGSYPDITVYSSAAGQKFAEELINKSFRAEVCKHERSIELGGGSLTFYITPNITWPDTIMTYASCGALFTGEFLSGKADKKEIERVFGGCREYVASALEVIKGINPDEIFTYSGLAPKSVLDLYKLFCSEKKKSGVAIAYLSHYGYTKKLAKALSEHIENAEIFDLSECDLSEAADKINNSDAFFLGTHTENGNLPERVWSLIGLLDTRKIKNLPYLVFGSGGWSNEGIYIADGVLQRLKMRRIDRPCISCLNPSEEEIKKLISAADKYREEE